MTKSPILLSLPSGKSPAVGTEPTTVTLLPCGPCGPSGPTGPCGPAAPVSPCGPAGPMGPWGPWGPTSPCKPGRPCEPAGPCGPCKPWGPGKPCAPAIPWSPGGPTGPCGPRIRPTLPQLVPFQTKPSPVPLMIIKSPRSLLLPSGSSSTAFTVPTTVIPPPWGPCKSIKGPKEPSGFSKRMLVPAHS